jgi:uncharacterized protein YkwD
MVKNLLTIFFLFVSTIAVAQSTSDFYQELNKLRAARGLSELKPSKSLERQSERWLKKTTGLKHDRSFKKYDAEVLAANGNALELWLNSPSHRKVILNEKATRIGVAFYNGRACARLIYLGP